MRPVVRTLIVAAATALSACTSAHEARPDRAVSSVAPRPPAAGGLDVSKLLALSIDEMSRQVGPPLPLPPGFVDPTLAPLVNREEHVDSAALFRCRGLAFVASYDHQTRQVSDLLLLGSNETELMARAHLELGAAHYLVLPVFQEQRPTQLLGLRVLALSVN
ncbi:MAG: hypothetical protein JWR44_3492 [Hymenobacter sp.]|jgi:hypothetical protein|nr:hypothetical protein [Hymenobacter sp.]